MFLLLYYFLYTFVLLIIHLKSNTMARINTKIIDDFKLLQEQLPEILKAYHINKTHLINNIDMSRRTFYTKLKARTFTHEEMKKISKYINR